MFAREQREMRTLGTSLIGLSWPLVIGASVFLVLLGRSELLNDGDIYWHIVIGRWIVEHFAIPMTDVFSHTTRGGAWTAHEWLSEILFAEMFRLAGWTGVVVLTAAASAAALAIVTRFLLRHLEPIYAVAFTALSAGLLAPHLVARPHALIAPLMALWCMACVDARESSRAPSWLTALIMPLWANLHASFVFGLVFVAVLGTEAVIEARSPAERWRAAHGWIVFGIIAFALSLLTPFGMKGLLFGFHVDQMAFALSHIVEWRSPDFQKLQPLELWLIVGGALALTRGIRLPVIRVVILLGLLHLALKHSRHADLLALVAPMLIAGPLGIQLRTLVKTPSHQSALDRLFAALVPRARPLTTGLTLALLVTAGFGQMITDSLHPAATITPKAALHAAKESRIEGPLFNAYEFGGYLIFSDVAPFIDGRTDLYGEQFISVYFAALNAAVPGLLQKLLEKYAITWTLLPPTAPAVSVLDELPEWRRFYSDEAAVIHARKRNTRGAL